jgi:hypothetical protein
MMNILKNELDRKNVIRKEGSLFLVLFLFIIGFNFLVVKKLKIKTVKVYPFLHNLPKQVHILIKTSFYLNFFMIFKLVVYGNQDVMLILFQTKLNLFTILQTKLALRVDLIIELLIRNKLAK